VVRGAEIFSLYLKSQAESTSEISCPFFSTREVDNVKINYLNDPEFQEIFLSMLPGTVLLFSLRDMQFDVPFSICGSQFWIEVPPVIIHMKISSQSKEFGKHCSTISALHYTSLSVKRNKQEEKKPCHTQMSTP
jgi:hypothetical protein